MASLFGWLAGKPAKSRLLKDAEETFSEAERLQLKRHFQEACTQQSKDRSSARNDGRQGLDAAHFAELVGPSWGLLEPLLQSKLLLLVSDPADGRVHLEGLLITKARLERLDEETSLETTFRLLADDREAISPRGLEAAVNSCLRLAGSLPPSPTGKQPSQPATSTASAGPPPTRATHSSVDSALAAHETAATGVAGEAAGGAHRGGSVAPVDLHVTAICRGALAFAAGADTPEAAAQLDWTSVRISFEKYCQWTKRCPALHRTLCGLLRCVGAGGGADGEVLKHPSQHRTQHPQPGALAGGGERGNAAAGQGHGVLPVLTQQGKLAAGSTLLQPAWVWALSSRLPPAQRAEWRLLFSSQRDGKSFNTFFGRVSSAAGPTLLLLRDKAGAMFGGYASQPWAKSGNYYGDVSCFIFSLLPAFQVFPATGINDNYQWCGVGFSQLPGGLGFGGAAASRGHFALYLEPSLDAGMSRPIATYGNCALASEQVFQIDTLECWLLQPPAEEDDAAQSDPSGSRKGAVSGGSGSGGVLGSKTAQDRAIMQLAGMQLHSEGLREEPLEEEG